MCRSFSLRVENLDGSNYVCRVAGLWGSIVPDKCHHKVCAQFTTYTQTHGRFMALFRDHPDELVPEEKKSSGLLVPGGISESDTLTIRLGATPSGLISDPPPSSPPFSRRMPFLPSNLFWLRTGTKYAGLHTQWLGCIPSGLCTIC